MGVSFRLIMALYSSGMYSGLDPVNTDMIERSRVIG
jgi:hypothetical protein